MSRLWSHNGYVEEADEFSLIMKMELNTYTVKINLVDVLDRAKWESNKSRALKTASKFCPNEILNEPSDNLIMAYKEIETAIRKIKMPNQLQ